MAFGFPANFSELIPLNNLSQPAFILTSISICKKLNWNLITIDENEIIAISKNKKDTWNETISITFDEENTAIVTSSSNGNQFYDRGRNKKNTGNFLNFYFEELKEISNPNLSQDAFQEQIKIEQKNLLTGKETERKITSFYSIFSIFIPSKSYFITPVLIYLNIIYFLIMIFSGVHFFAPTVQEIIDWGGNHGPLTYENQYWRLLSACFVHIGFFHLVTNCITLAYVGLLLESYLKKWIFLITYLFCGILASLSSLYWNKDLVSAGASGAIFGMFGVLLIAALGKRIDAKLTAKIVFLVVLNICYSFSDGIDSAAHIGGFLAGIVFGLTVFISGEKRKIGLASIYSAALISIICLYINLKSSQVYIYQIMEYEKRMQEFVDMEKMALEAYSVQYGNSYSENKESTLYLIKDRGIYYWNENITLMTELDKLYLPKEIHEQNERLIEYCKLRISFYELAYKKIVENSTLYDEKMLALDFKISSIMNQINKANPKS